MQSTKMRNHLILCAAVLLTGAISAEESKTDRQYVMAAGGLNMRNEPNVGAQVVLLIPENAEVTVLERTGEEVEIGGKRGKWTKVSFGSQRGWVFGGFLAASRVVAIPVEAEGTYDESPCDMPGPVQGLHLFKNSVHRTTCTGEEAWKVVRLEQKGAEYHFRGENVNNPDPAMKDWIIFKDNGVWKLKNKSTGKMYSRKKSL
ncbi:MAG: SH3 domain-containing protein [Leptospirales bacterium]|nr:SH3 domain-containing protein [Leptospirales bacterium]